MGAVLAGFASLAVVVALGYLLARYRVLGEGADAGLSRLAFYAATPALMFRTVADADVVDVFSAGAAVNGLTMVALVVLYVVPARFLLRRRGAELTLGALSASYVNAGNLGIPILVFAVGDAAAIAPVLLYQLLVMVPVSFSILDVQTGRGGTGRLELLLMPLRNPLVLAVLAGLLVSVAGLRLPEVVLMPIDLVGAMAVPVMLVAFGFSLYGAPLPGRGQDGAAALALAVVLKVAAAPAIALALGSLVFDLSGTALLGTVVAAALPTAQNVFVYAMRYGRAVPLVRDTILITTAASVVAIVALVGVLG